MQARQDDDAQRTLGELAHLHGSPIVSLLLEIQESQVLRGKDLHFLRTLECFRPDVPSRRPKRKRGADDDDDNDGGPGPTAVVTLHRPGPVNAYTDPNYVALSYAWSTPTAPHPGAPSDVYRVQARDGGRWFPARLRDRVFDRALAYMRHRGVPLLWVDRYCIPQRVCGQAPDCQHDRCLRKQHGLQAMDLVYKYSDHPVGLMEGEVADAEELDLLAAFLEGRLVCRRSRKGASYALSPKLAPRHAKMTLGLVHRLTGDLWWRRAWVFQENYRAGRGMALLLGHPVSLERAKREHKAFGDVPGELCFKSVDFSYEATRLCLALQARQDLEPGEVAMAEEVLRAAGRYQILVPESRAMSPRIISDIEAKDITNVWDRMAIVANCCKYSLRLDDEELREHGRSLSLSTLVMYLLNGEILHNAGSRSPDAGAAHMTTSAFLRAQSFDGFRAPRDRRSLTFNKGCRFTNPRLTEAGIRTRGHLWQLGDVIQTKELREEGTNFARAARELHVHARLTQLARVLETSGRLQLARQLMAYMERDWLSESSEASLGSEADSDGKVDFDSEVSSDAEVGSDSDESEHGSESDMDPGEEVTISEQYRRSMAAELTDAIDQGRPLRLAHLLGRPEASAVFVWSEDWDENAAGLVAHGAQGRVPGFVFTCTAPSDVETDEYDPNDIDRHVSLEVLRKDGDGSSQDDGDVPMLYTHRWLTGLFFPRGCAQDEVIFPWPSELVDIVP